MIKSNRGFTLIEVIISVSILAFISIYTAQTIQTGLKSKKKIQTRIDRDSQLRDSLKVMANDIRQAFNYHDINIELFNNAQDERKKLAAKPAQTQKPDSDGGTTPPTTPDPAAANQQTKTYDKKTEVVLTHFLGQKDSLHFTTTSHSRSIVNSQVSNQSEVGYSVKGCRSRSNPEHTSQCLWRRVSPVIDDNVDEGGEEMVLLENVTRFELRYLGPQREEDWVDSWMTDIRGDVVTKGIFPFAVEITLEVHNKNIAKSKPLAMTLVAPISFPNNLEKKASNEKSTQPLSK